MALIQAHILAFVFGFLGNIVQFMVYLAPLPTFFKIVKKKSTQEFQSIPYSVTLFSSMLFLYYGFLKANWMFIVLISLIGCIIESIYLVIYLTYATKNSKIYTIKLLVLFNICAYGAIIICTHIFLNGNKRIAIVGGICAIFSVCVSAAPLSVVSIVIKTKSVEFMSISLSFFLTLGAVIWSIYGFLIKDYFIAGSNMLQFLFGIAQMILYAMYKDAKIKDIELNDNNKFVTLEELLKKDNGPPMIAIVRVNDKSTF